MNDGDTALVIQDDVLIEVAERHMSDVVPLYYEMQSAKASKIEPEVIYESLTAAYKANIGIISNDITKVWNSGFHEDEVVKWLTMVSNYEIDYAKTLFKLEIPEDKKEKIKKYTNLKTPHFFRYAKGKTKDQVQSLFPKEYNHLGSTVNKLYDLIKNPRLQIQNVDGEFYYENLMYDKKTRMNTDLVNYFIELIKIQRNEKKEDNKDEYYSNHKIEMGMDMYYNDKITTVDILIKYAYTNKKISLLKHIWNIYGDIIYDNLKRNLDGFTQCCDCGLTIVANNNKKKYCEQCFKIMRKEYKRIKEKERRERNRGQIEN